MELNELENLGGIGADADANAEAEAQEGETPQPLLSSMQKATPVMGVSGYDVIADLLPHEELKALNKWVQTYHVDGNDPFFGGYIMAKTTFSAAIAAGQAATIIHDDIGKLPDVIYRAVTAGAGEVSGQIKTAMVANVRELAQAIQMGIAKATQPSVLAVQTALQDFDQKVDKTILARRDAVLAQWVQSGSDALDDRVREAIKTERTVNLMFMSFGFSGVFVLGIILGMHVHF